MYAKEFTDLYQSCQQESQNLFCVKMQKKIFGVSNDALYKPPIAPECRGAQFNAHNINHPSTKLVCQIAATKINHPVIKNGVKHKLFEIQKPRKEKRLRNLPSISNIAEGNCCGHRCGKLIPVAFLEKHRKEYREGNNV